MSPLDMFGDIVAYVTIAMYAALGAYDLYQRRRGRHDSAPEDAE